MTKHSGLYRPPIRKGYLRMLAEMVHKINSTNMGNDWQFVDVVLYAIEMLYKKMFTDKALPGDIKGLRRPYYKDVDITD